MNEFLNHCYVKDIKKTNGETVRVLVQCVGQPEPFFVLADSRTESYYRERLGRQATLGIFSSSYNRFPKIIGSTIDPVPDALFFSKSQADGWNWIRAAIGRVVHTKSKKWAFETQYSAVIQSNGLFITVNDSYGVLRVGDLVMAIDCK